MNTYVWLFHLLTCVPTLRFLSHIGDYIDRSILNYFIIYVWVKYLQNSLNMLEHRDGWLNASIHRWSCANRAFRTCSSIFICFCKQQLWLAKINHVIYSSQSQLLLAKTNEDQITGGNTLFQPTLAVRPENQPCGVLPGLHITLSVIITLLIIECPTINIIHWSL